mgnify:CR=1 FL=1
MKLTITLLFLLFLFGCDYQDAPVSPFPSAENPLDQPDVLKKSLENSVDLGELRVSLEQGVKVYRILRENKLYSGWIRKTYQAGSVGYLFYCVEGRQDGLHTSWHENGKKMVERMWSNGTRHGPFTIWSTAGILESRGFMKNNLMHGLVEEFYSNGVQKSLIQYQNGKIDTFFRWKPNGTKCPNTTIVDGKGIVFHYHEDNTIDSNESYWEGEIDYGQSTKTIIKKVELDAVVEENLEDVSGEATIGINRNGFNGQSSLDLESSLDENNTPN